MTQDWPEQSLTKLGAKKLEGIMINLIPGHTVSMQDSRLWYVCLTKGMRKCYSETNKYIHDNTTLTKSLSLTQT